MTFLLLVPKASGCSILTPFASLRTLSRTTGEGGPGPQGWVGEGYFGGAPVPVPMCPDHATRCCAPSDSISAGSAAISRLSTGSASMHDRASGELVNELANPGLHEHPASFETALRASSG